MDEDPIAPNTVKKFNASVPQQQHLLTRINEIAANMVDVDFSDPKLDEQNIRYIIRLRGEMLAMAELSRDLYEVPPPELPADHPSLHEADSTSF